MSGAHDSSHEKFNERSCAARFDIEILVIVSAYLNKGGTTVDHTLRLDVLAVCAVFTFVGAVLLGAF
jgi:hypothetical protein